MVSLDTDMHSTAGAVERVKKACNQSGESFKLRAASAKSGKTYYKIDSEGE